MKITYTRENTHIEDSYQIKLRKSIRNIVEEIVFVRDAKMYPITRKNYSYTCEWVGHNRLYRLGDKLKDKALLTKIGNYLIAHAKDADLEENIKKWKELIWLIIGI